MTARRRSKATVQQHMAASHALRTAWDANQEAIRVLGLTYEQLDPAHGAGSVTAKETEVLLKIQNAILRARLRLEERLKKDHPEIDPIGVYFTRSQE